MGAVGLVVVGQPADLVERGPDELDRVRVIFGLDVAPSTEVIDTSADRQARCAESHELVVLVRSRFVSTDPTNEGRASVRLGQRADSAHVVTEVGEQTAKRTDVRQSLLNALRLAMTSDDLDELIEQITVDAYGDGGYWSFLHAIDDDSSRSWYTHNRFMFTALGPFA